MTDTILHTLICEDEAGDRVKVQYVATPDGPRYVMDPPREAESPQLETRWHPELLIDYALRNELRPLGAIVMGDTQPVRYTPGGWGVFPGPHNEGLRIAPTRRPATTIGTADGRFVSEDELRANAALLAAAPDLHRALYALRHGRLPDSDVAMLPSDIHALVDEALTKAAGA